MAKETKTQGGYRDEDMKKWYGGKDDERLFCTSLNDYIEWEVFNNLNNDIDVDVYEYVYDHKGQGRFCLSDGESFESGSGFCDYCESYIPRNGKNGICKHIRKSLKHSGIFYRVSIRDGKLSGFTKCG